MDFDEGNGPVPPAGGDDDLELDLPPGEEARASVPLNPGRRRDSTMTMEETPLPPGASISSDGALEPLLAGFEEPWEGPPGKALPPPFFARLAQGEGQAISVTKEAPLTWSLRAGDAWPVFVRRHVLKSPMDALKLKEIALAAGRYGGNRLSLSPQGALDLFFNDRASLDKADSALGDLGRELKGVPASINSCRGLFLCPYAAVDTLALESGLVAALRSRGFRPGGSLASISIHGCPSGGGARCGVGAFADFRLIGARDGAPLIDQGILGLSPFLERLVSECPGKALSVPASGPNALDLDESSCTRCGLCLATDPSFHWPEPQGGYLRLELSGRRKALSAGAFIRPRELVARVDGNRAKVFDRMARLIAMWRKGRKPSEIIADYVDRLGLGDFFSGL